jgi:endonuclease/exonuclease/phosphatase (EEP) superfamily protein YafD
MKPYRLFWLSLLNSYHILLGLYWILRGVFGGAFWWLALLNTFAIFVAIPLLLTLPVALLIRGKRTSAIAVFLLLLAIVKYVPAPKPTPAPSDHTLRIISYNIWNQNRHLDSDIDWMLEQNADVLVLVEAVQHHLPTLSRLAIHYPYYQRVDSNIMVASRYPMLENEVIVLEKKTSPYDGRVALRAVLDVQGQPMTVYAVHLSVPRQRVPAYPRLIVNKTLHIVQHYNESRRNAQIAVLLNHVQQENNPVIIAGDFNMSHTSAIYEAFVEAGLVDTYATAGAGFGMSWPVHHTLPPVLRIDYVWHNNLLRTVAARIGEQRGSDHTPLIVDIEVMGH